MDKNLNMNDLDLLISKDNTVVSHTSPIVYGGERYEPNTYSIC